LSIPDSQKKQEASEILSIPDSQKKQEASEILQWGIVHHNINAQSREYIEFFLPNKEFRQYLWLTVCKNKEEALTGNRAHLQNVDKMCLSVILQTIRTVKSRRIQST